jgi:hypothetical protein
MWMTEARKTDFGTWHGIRGIVRLVGSPSVPIVIDWGLKAPHTKPCGLKKDPLLALSPKYRADSTAEQQSHEMTSKPIR